MVQGHMSSLNVPSLRLPSLAARPLGSFGIELSVNRNFIDTTLPLPLPPNSPHHNFPGHNVGAPPAAAKLA
jgi:hypothetical protein